MRLAYFSDIHTEIGPQSVAVTLNQDVDILILAGDIGKSLRGLNWAYDTFKDRARDIVMIAGNHDHWGNVYTHTLEKMRARSAQLPGMHFLENMSVELHGYTFIGATAWTDFSYGPENAGIHKVWAADRDKGMRDYKKIRWHHAGGYGRITPDIIHKLNIESHGFIFSEIERVGHDRAIVVTHHAPTELSIDPTLDEEDHKYDGCYCNQWGTEIAYKGGPLYWFHGHIHRPVDYWIADTHVLSNPIDYPFYNRGRQPVYLTLD